jgi:hypothetical protein
MNTTCSGVPSQKADILQRFRCLKYNIQQTFHRMLDEEALSLLHSGASGN